MLGNTGNRPLIRVFSAANGSQIISRSLSVLGFVAKKGAARYRIMSKKDRSNRSTEYAVKFEIYLWITTKI
jgi:hypothetical protein